MRLSHRRGHVNNIAFRRQYIHGRATSEKKIFFFVWQQKQEKKKTQK